ncbi:hypothetical protein P3T43_002195 [Paraburkholderia sp. GAS41]|jgi:hypothetical protein|uniref:hypothetical protein n=1 Tax=Paraburkholderia sp. GAS41 TaxID=3035134 RepID=UPI003D1D5E84
MNIAARLREFTGTAVIVDDNYKDPDLDSIEDTQWAEMRDISNDAWKALAEARFPGMRSPLELRRNQEQLKTAWKLYKEDAAAYSMLDPIFRGLLDQYEGELKQLKPLMNFLRDDAKLTLKCHPSLAEAEEDIKGCKLVFLDFYLEQTTPDEVITAASQFRECLKSDVMEHGNAEGRFVYLMSSNLPLDRMEDFRKATKLKSAFFRFVEKPSLNAIWLERDLEPKLELYGDMRGLSKYLDTFSTEIDTATKFLVDEIDSLELHDLTLLHSLRLERESEGLGEYLSWLFSEALAAKIRARSRLHAAAHIVNHITALPFNGEIHPNSVLLDLYADVTFAGQRPSKENPAVRFGDVFSENVDMSSFPDNPNCINNHTQPASNKRHAAILARRRNIASTRAQTPDYHRNGPPPLSAAATARRKRNLLRRNPDTFLLAISPACDLQRCPADYQVMLVKGHVAVRSPNLEDLLAAKPFAGKYHLLREVANNSYVLVKWDEKSCIMVRARDLRDSSKYLLRGRLNEVLCHETKELALRHLGRVGVQVDPSFSIGLGGVFRLKVAQNDVRNFVVPEDFFAGIRMEGNGNNDHRYVLSRALAAWVREQLEPFKMADGLLPFKLPNILEFLDSGHVPQFDWDEAKASKVIAKNSLKVFFTKDIKSHQATGEYELVLYPRRRGSSAIES